MKRSVIMPLMAAALIAGCAAPQGGMPARSVSVETRIHQISAADLQKRLESGQETFLIDVRTQEEWDQGHIAEAKLMPLQNLEQAIKGVPKDREIVIICRSGNRSMQAAEILAKEGYTNLINIQGGMLDWKGPVTK